MANLENPGNGPGAVPWSEDIPAHPLAAVTPAVEEDCINSEDTETQNTTAKVLANLVPVVPYQEKDWGNLKQDALETSKTDTKEFLSEPDDLPDIDDEPKLLIAEETEMDVSENPVSPEDTNKPHCSKDSDLDVTSGVDGQNIEEENEKLSHDNEELTIEQPNSNTFKINDDLTNDKLEINEDINVDKPGENIGKYSDEPGRNGDEEKNKPNINEAPVKKKQEPEESQNQVSVETKQDKPNSNVTPVQNEQDKQEDLNQDKVYTKSDSVTDKQGDNKKQEHDKQEDNKKQADDKPGEADISRKVDRSESANAKANTPTSNSDRTAPFDWSSLGVHRCLNCKFTTNDIQLYNNHVTTCCSSKFNHGQVSISSSIGIPMNYACETCSLTWTNKAEFEEHVVCHITDNPYLCITCKKNFHSRYSIEKHAKTDHPSGDSRCALRGMKKCREYVKAVELAGKFAFEGKLHIPKTPRNQIKDGESRAEGAGTVSAVSENTPANVNSGAAKPVVISLVDDKEMAASKAAKDTASSPVLEKRDHDRMETEETSTESENTTVATMPSPRPNLSKFMNTSITSVEVNDHKKQATESVTLTKASHVVATNQPLNRGTTSRSTIDYFPSATTASTTPSTSSQESNPNALFKVMDSLKGTIQPLPLPSKIQKLVNVTPGNTETNPRTEVSMPPPPPYHVKHITEFTKAVSQNTATPAVTTLSSTPVWLIPVGPPMPLNQPSVQSPRNMVPSNQTMPHLQATRAFQPTGQMSPTPLTLNAPQSNQFVVLRPEANVNTQAVTSVTSSLMTAGNVALPRQTEPQTRLAAPAARVPWARWPAPLPPALLNPGPPIPPPPIGTQAAVDQSQVRPALKQWLNVSSQPPVSSGPPLATTASTNFVTIPSSSNRENQEQIAERKILDKTYTFRIKPQKGFVCESCRKYTRDELVFRKHVWEHFHVGSSTCKYCKKEKIDNAKKGVTDCVLVNEIVCKLVKNTVKMRDINETIVIDITGDDEEEVVAAKSDEKSKDTESKAIEVIVVDDDIESENDGLNIKITSTYSLSDVEVLENMSKEVCENTSKLKESSKDLGKIEGTDNSKGLDSTIPGINTSSPVEHENINFDEADEPVLDDDGDDEDMTIVEKELVNKSLTKPEKCTNEIVSKTIDKIFAGSSLKENVDIDTDVDKENYYLSKKDATDVLYVQKSTESSNSAELISTVNCLERSSDSSVYSKKEVFEAEVIAALGHNAFYMCGYEHCSFSCLTTQGYKEHLQSKHVNELNNFVCCHCGRKDYNEDSHVRHMNSHTSNSTKTFFLYKCPLRQCKYKTNLPRMYKEHVTKHDEPIIKCVYCNKIFPSIDSLLRHLNQNLLKFVSCPHCPFKFIQKHVVVKHISLFHPDKPRMVTVTSQIVCQDREINFYVEPLAKKSVEKDVEKEVPSTDIIRITELLDEVENNDEQVPGNENRDMEIDVVSNPETNTARKQDESEPPVITPEAKVGTKVSAKLKSKSSLGPKSLKCPQCSFLSYNLALHIQHVSLHENQPERGRRYVCNLCPKGMDNYNQFKTHVTNHIGKNEIKIFSCTSCSYSSNQKCHIMDHCADNHNGKGMYVQTITNVKSTEVTCKYCDFKARQPEQVMQHEELTHRVTSVDGAEAPDRPPVLEKQTDGNKKAEGEVSKKRKYHCEYCQNFFKHKVDLKEHLEKEHLDIENKEFVFYKCKYCSLTSTMKDVIVAHMGKAHPGSEMRILRKAETVKSAIKPDPEIGKQQSDPAEDPEQIGNENIVKERIGIPDGNTFKHPFQCTKCSFSSNLRIKVMRHIKTHPELTPVREAQLNSQKTATKTTARKTTTGFSHQDFPVRKHGALYQDIPSSQLHNPFSALKNAADKSNEDETEPYALGENDLHSKLSACFIPLEKDVLFRCRICNRKIAKKFVIHRHILDHLDIVFFKCRYCQEGTIEKSLLFGHIQKEHPQKPLNYTKVSKAELDNQFKDKIFGQDFNDTVSIDSASDRSINPAEDTGIIKKSVDESTETAVAPEKKSKISENSNKCPYCVYTSSSNFIMKKHISAHSDPIKNVVCSECEYRGSRFHVLRHCYARHGRAKMREDNGLTSSKLQLSNTQEQKNKAQDIEKQEVAKLTTVEAKDSNEQVQETDSHDIEKPDDKMSGRTESPNSTSSVDEKESMEKTSSKGASEKNHYIKTMYKCKECGLTRDSMSSMYHHFKLEKKCNRPVYKCSLCTFKSALKMDVTKHGKIRHPGKKPAVVTLALRAKIRTIKIPVRFKGVCSKAKSEDRSVASSADSRASSVASTEDSRVSCQLCHYKSDTVMALQFHINTKHGGKLLHCQECQYKTPLVKHMINHCTNVHMQKVAIYKQEPKGLSMKSSKPDDDTGNDDSKTPGKQRYSCSKCDYATDVNVNLRRHLFTHFTYRPYRCKFCDVTRSERSSLKRHFDREHPSKPLFKYSYVKDEGIENKVDILYKRALKSKKQGDMSTGASRPARLDKLDLMEEVVRKDGIFYYCDFCGLKSVKKTYIKKHYEAKHAANAASLKKRPLEPDETEKSSPPRKFPKLEKKGDTSLDICTSDESEEEEEEEEDSENRPAVLYSVVLDPDGTRKFKCPKCDYKSENKSYVYKHMKTHAERLFKCFYCELTTKLLWNAYRHIQNMHKGFEVKVVNKTTNEIMSPRKPKGTSPAPSDRTSPARSVKDMGSIEELPPFRPQKESHILSYCCNVCSSKVEGMYQFRQHLASHPDEFTYIVDSDARMSCGYCSYRAIDENDFSGHIATHLEERRFKCYHCEYTAFIRNLVVKHSRYMHPGEIQEAVDRHKRIDTVSKLVNLDPKVLLKRVAMPNRKQKKYRRIRFFSEDSSDDSSSESNSAHRMIFDEQDETVGKELSEHERDADESNSSATETEEMETSTSETVQMETAVSDDQSVSAKEDDEVYKLRSESTTQEISHYFTETVQMETAVSDDQSVSAKEDDEVYKLRSESTTQEISHYFTKVTCNKRFDVASKNMEIATDTEMNFAVDMEEDMSDHKEEKTSTYSSQLLLDKTLLEDERLEIENTENVNQPAANVIYDSTDKKNSSLHSVTLESEKTDILENAKTGELENVGQASANVISDITDKSFTFETEKTDILGNVKTDKLESLHKPAGTIINDSTDKGNRPLQSSTLEREKTDILENAKTGELENVDQASANVISDGTDKKNSPLQCFTHETEKTDKVENLKTDKLESLHKPAENVINDSTDKGNRPLQSFTLETEKTDILDNVKFDKLESSAEPAEKIINDSTDKGNMPLQSSTFETENTDILENVDKPVEKCIKDNNHKESIPFQTLETERTDKLENVKTDKLENLDKPAENVIKDSTDKGNRPLQSSTFETEKTDKLENVKLDKLESSAKPAENIINDSTDNGTMPLHSSTFETEKTDILDNVKLDKLESSAKPAENVINYGTDKGNMPLQSSTFETEKSDILENLDKPVEKCSKDNNHKESIPFQTLEVERTKNLKHVMTDKWEHVHTDKLENVNTDKLESIDEPAPNFIKEVFDKESSPSETLGPSKQENVINSGKGPDPAEDSEMCLEATVNTSGSEEEIADAKGDKSPHVSKSEDPETRTNENSELESMSENTVETQAFESAEENIFNHQHSQGFDMGTQNFDMLESNQMLGQDSTNSDKENIEEMDISNKSEQELKTSEAESADIDTQTVCKPSESQTTEMEINNETGAADSSPVNVDKSNAVNEEMDVD